MPTNTKRTDETPLRCPCCKNCPVEDGVPIDEELDYFDAIGADWDTLFCPVCQCQFSMETGEAVD